MASYRAIILTLLLVSSCFADTLHVVASGDNYITPPTITPGAKSFSIINADAGLVSCTYITASTSLGANTHNFGSSVTLQVGKTSGAEMKALIRWESLDDSMKALDPDRTAIWDSARITFSVSTAPSSNDTLQFAVYRLNSNRIFGEGTSNDAVGLGASNHNYDSTSGTAFAWTTAGAGTSDYNATWIDTSRRITPGDAAATKITAKITSAAITDTMNMAGVILSSYRYGTGTTTATTQRVVFNTDDATTDTLRPRITVYYTIPEVNYGAADSLIVNSDNAAKPVFTFDLSALPASSDLDSIRGWFYVTGNYSVSGTEGWVYRWQGARKPINVGNNSGTQADAGEMHWGAWYEVTLGTSADDSTWGTIGAENTGTTCNRSDGSGHDRTQYTTTTTVGGSGTGWKSSKADTNIVRAFLAGGCNNFAAMLVGGVVTGDAGSKAFLKIEAIDHADNHPAYWVIYYHPGATTRGLGRFGRGSDGVYRNDR